MEKNTIVFSSPVLKGMNHHREEGHNPACTKIAPSKIPGVSGGSLFATRVIYPNEQVAKFIHSHTMVNDGVARLAPVIRASKQGKEAFVKALSTFERNYVDRHYVESHTNAEADNQGEGIHATRTIKPGEEILRYYGTLLYWVPILYNAIDEKMKTTLINTAARWTERSRFDWSLPQVEALIAEHHRVVRKRAYIKSQIIKHKRDANSAKKTRCRSTRSISRVGCTTPRKSTRRRAPNTTQRSTRKRYSTRRVK